MHINIAKVDFGRCCSGGGVEYDSEYLTLSALEDGEITITIPSYVNQDYATSLSYSKDKSSWSEPVVIDDTDQTITIPVSTGDKVYLKGEARQWSVNSYPMYSMNINSSTNIISSGNIMSLLYEDDFKDKTAFPGGAIYIFRGLFKDNTHLINAENLILPATTLTNGCYQEMFHGCTALTTAPELPATVLAVYCCQNMFYGCSSLAAVPELPATTLASQCYYEMFSGCTSLTTAPALPATTLASGCYSNMFYGCSSLAAAPELPATALGTSCYDSMFYGCSSLAAAPELPATTLASGCYSFMFSDCTSLTTAPELPATALADYCYRYMFDGCTSLNGITMLATDISASNCLTDWVRNVSSTGTFTKAASMTSLPTGISGIPSGWTVVDYTDYLTLSALGDGEITITIPSYINATYATSLSYSKDKSSWTPTAIDDTDQTITIPVFSGEDVYLKGEAKQWCYFNSGSVYSTHIGLSTNIIASGNIMSLLYDDDFKDKISFPGGSEWTFAQLFEGDTYLKNVENLILPATTLGRRCYSGMFYNCTSLTTAPELPATTLAAGCYNNMFYSCSSLTAAPELPATTLASGCYSSMFYGCSSLNNITMLATDISATNCLSNWVNGVASTGTFIKSPSMSTLPTGTSGIPSGWTVIDYYPAEYLTLSALEDGEITITIPSYVNSTYATSLSYSKDKSNWTPTTVDSTYQTITIPVSTGDKVYLQGIALRWAITPGPPSSASINSTANIIASGNIMSLLYGEDFKDKITFPNEAGFVFWELFKNNTHLINAENLILPATTLTQYCYYAMFQDCTSLTAAPELPATTLAQNCYYSMFQKCSSLNNITMLATDISATNCLSNWVNGVASTGTFTKAASMTTLPTGVNGIPSGWTVVNK